MLAIAAVTLFIFLFLGVPVSFAICFSGLIGVYFGSNTPLIAVLQQMVRGINSFPLMAIPFFVLGGEIMGEAKLSERIINFCRSLVQWMRGGLGMVCVLANMVFAGITGSGAAAISAIGSITTPELKKAGYKRSFVSSLISGAGALGPIIPPSVNMIVYASLTGDSVGKMFLGGVIPGLIIGGALMILCYLYAKRHNIDKGDDKFCVGNVFRVLKKSFFALITPLIIIVGVISGIFTATEAGVVSCIYGILCGFFIYRTLHLRDLPGIFRRATESSAMILMIMAAGSIYSFIFAKEQIGQKMTAFLLSVSNNPLVIMVLIIIAVLIVGCFMETTAVTVVVVPIIYPLVKQLGIDVIQFGVLFVIAGIVGGLTPPVGLYLFMAMDITKAPFKEAIRYTAPVVAIMALVLVLIMFIPGVVTLLPNMLM